MTGLYRNGYGELYRVDWERSGLGYRITNLSHGGASVVSESDLSAQIARGWLTKTSVSELGGDR